MKVEDLNKGKIPIVKIDKKLEKAIDRFEERLSNPETGSQRKKARANSVLVLFQKV